MKWFCKYIWAWKVIESRKLNTKDYFVIMARHFKHLFCSWEGDSYLNKLCLIPNMKMFWFTHVWKACIFKVWLLQLSQISMPCCELLSYECIAPSYHNSYHNWYSFMIFFIHVCRVICIKFTCQSRKQSMATAMGPPTLPLCLHCTSKLTELGSHATDSRTCHSVGWCPRYRSHVQLSGTWPIKFIKELICQQKCSRCQSWDNVV